MGIRKYGNSEDKKILEDSNLSKEIVKEIMDTNPSQRILLFILNDLSLNLENLEHCKKMKNLLEEIIEEIENSSTLIV